MPAQTGVPIQRRWWPVQKATTDANGNATITWPNVGQGRVWLVDMMVITAGGALAGSCGLYFDDVAAQGYITRSINAIADTFEGLLEVPSGSQLIAAFSALDAGVLCTARLHYTEEEIVNVGFDPTFLRFKGP